MSFPGWVTCPVCGKHAFGSRKEARRVAKARFPGHHMNAYECREGFWHFGHLPSRALRGQKSRGRAAELSRRYGVRPVVEP